MSELFTGQGINTEVLQGYLGDKFYNDPEKQQPTKAFENVKDEKTFVNNYLEAQRMISKGEAAFAEKTKGMVKIPGEGATPDEIKAYNKAVGVPDSADKYELAIPAENNMGMKEIAEVVKAEAFAIGIPAKSLTGLWGKVVSGLQAQNKAIEEKGLAIMQQETEALKAKYKEKYDSFVKVGDAALAKFQNGPAISQILNDYGLSNSPAVRELLYEIAPLVLEKQTIGGQGAAQSGEQWFTDYKIDTQPQQVQG